MLEDPDDYEICTIISERFASNNSSAYLVPTPEQNAPTKKEGKMVGIWELHSTFVARQDPLWIAYVWKRPLYNVPAKYRETKVPEDSDY